MGRVAVIALITTADTPNSTAAPLITHTPHRRRACGGDGGGATGAGGRGTCWYPLAGGADGCGGAVSGATAALPGGAHTESTVGADDLTTSMG